MIEAISAKPMHPDDLATLIAHERRRLIGLCAQLAGSTTVAEDLAQEVLVEALRLRHRLYDPGGLVPWLNAIARNICARWRRRQGRELAHRPAGGAAAVVDSALPDSWDIEVELERRELVELLDRALAQLPVETRTVLLARYVEELPHAAIAQRLRVSEAAVAMRLQRGRLALARVLGGALRAEAAAYGLAATEQASQPTGIWCPFCGQQRLNSLIDRANGLARFICPACRTGQQCHIAALIDHTLLASLRSPKAILSRQIRSLHHYYRQALSNREAPCLICGRMCRVNWQLPPDIHLPQVSKRGITIYCSPCAYDNLQPLDYLVLDLPEVQRFWRQHSRMRLIGERSTHFQGRKGVITRFENISGTASIDVVSALDTFEVLVVEATPQLRPTTTAVE